MEIFVPVEAQNSMSVCAGILKQKYLVHTQEKVPANFNPRYLLFCVTSWLWNRCSISYHCLSHVIGKPSNIGF